MDLRYSNDGGENWSNWRSFATSSTGNFRQKLVARRLGFAEERIWEQRDTGDRAIDLLSASLYVESE